MIKKGATFYDKNCKKNNNINFFGFHVKEWVKHRGTRRDKLITGNDAVTEDDGCWLVTDDVL